MAAETLPAAMGLPVPPMPAPAPPATLAVPGQAMPPGSGMMIMGHVRSWMEDRGMGFISPDDGGDDAFVHRSQLVDGVCLLVGSPVIFEDNWDVSKNKRVAKKVTGAAPAEAKGAGKGTPLAELAMPDLPLQPRGVPPATIGQMITGVVKTWKDERGMGFIAPANGGDDAFCHRSSLVDGQWLVVGSPVVFEDNWDHMKSKRIAKNVQGAVSAEGKGACGACGACGGKGGQVAALPVDTTGMLPGTCKAWYEDRGMGFLRPATGGEDVFIHRSGLIGAQVLVSGMQVLYQEGWDPTKGKMMAVKCVPADQGASAAATQPGAAGTSYMGTVKAWFDERGMGFVVPDGGGEDIFVHRSALVDGQWLVVGAHVSFELGWDPSKNKHIARNVSGANQASGGQPGVAPDGMRTGTVKMWFAEKAFGFIIPDAGGEDVMVHKNEVTEGLELVQGMPVKFDAVWDPAKGKYKASRCIASNAYGGAAAYGAAAPAPGGGGKGGSFPPSDNLFIAGLPLGYTEDSIKQVFGQYGAVASCRVLNNPGKPDLACMVRMVDANMAMWMVENLHGNIPVGLGTPVTVRFAQPVGYGKASGKGCGGKDRGSPYPAATPALPAPPAPSMGAPGMLGLDGTLPAAMPGTLPETASQYQAVGGFEAQTGVAAWPPAQLQAPEAAAAAWPPVAPDAFLAAAGLQQAAVDPMAAGAYGAEAMLGAPAPGAYGMEAPAQCLV